MWIEFALILLASLAALHVWWWRKLRRERALWHADSARRSAGDRAAQAEAIARQDALLDSMIEGVLVLDEKGLVLFANQAFATMFSTTGILRGKSILEAARLPELPGIVQRAATEGGVEDFELRLPGEPERWLQVNAASITSVERRRLGTILVFHDLTRIKKLERTREEFVANVSHELRTPLSLIKGYTETLLHGAKDDPAVADRFLQTIARNSDRLTLLIEDLLTISELESGRVRLDLKRVSLRPLAEKLVEDFKTRAGARQVTLSAEIGDLDLNADAARVEQVLSNLLDNAIKYGRAGGRVLVTAKRAEDSMVQISVEDDGPGLPVESLDRVFERFYRVDKARSREQGGTGLGLSIVKHIVQSHGGRVWAESQPGKGAKFFFTLPLAV